MIIPSVVLRSSFQGLVASVRSWAIGASMTAVQTFGFLFGYRKAMGLNLKERSSGKHQGKLRITKRGPSIARRWLYFAAMRTIQEPAVRRWYEAKKAKDQDRGQGALSPWRGIGVGLALVGAARSPLKPGDCFRDIRCREGLCMRRAAVAS